MKKDESENCGVKECVLMHKVVPEILRQVYSDYDLVTPTRFKIILDIFFIRFEVFIVLIVC